MPRIFICNHWHVLVPQLQELATHKTFKFVGNRELQSALRPPSMMKIISFTLDLHFISKWLLIVDNLGAIMGPQQFAPQESDGSLTLQNTCNTEKSNSTARVIIRLVQMARYFRGEKKLQDNIKYSKHTFYVCYLSMKIFLAYVKHSLIYNFNT